MSHPKIYQKELSSSEGLLPTLRTTANHILETTERDIIASVLVQGIITDDFKVITPSMITDTALSCIWEHMLAVYNNNGSVDSISLSEALRKSKKLKDVGGVYFITTLTSEVFTYPKPEWARFIKVGYFTRYAISKIQSALTSIISEDLVPTTAIGKLYQELLAIDNDIFPSSDNTSVQKYAEEIDANIESVRAGITKPWLSCGYSNIDTIQNGLSNGEVIIVAARPAMGKTAYATNIAINVAKQGHAALIFSLEMSGNNLTDRIIAIEANINAQKMRTPKNMNPYDYHKYKEASAKVAQLPIYIEDNPTLTIEDIDHLIGLYIRKKQVRFVIIDYIQLCGTRQKFNVREQEVSHISRSIKIAAKKYKIPIMALSQLSRQVESRADKTPVLSDLRESGSLEQDPDIVQFLFRPEYYGMFRDETGNDLTGVLKVIIAKNRNGALANSYLDFDMITTKINDANYTSFSY